LIENTFVDCFKKNSLFGLCYYNQCIANKKHTRRVVKALKMDCAFGTLPEFSFATDTPAGRSCMCFPICSNEK
jgi:hypothetical protein